jgi:hypothetical protein
MRPVFGLMLIVSALVAVWLVPWSAVLDSVFSGEDDRIPWIPADGARYSAAAFPELYTVMKSIGRTSKDHFQVPDFTDQHDFLANSQFGSRIVYRCISTYRLEDHTPAGTLGWCAPHGN